MKPMWRVRYCDGTSVDSLTTSPERVPAAGVQTVVQWVNGQRQILHGFALYYWVADLECWWGGDVMGFLELAGNDNRAQYPKRGLNCRDFSRIFAATVHDADFDPAKRADA